MLNSKFLFTVIAIFLIISNLYSTDNKEDSTYIVTSENGLILRNGPGTNYNKITVIPYNEKVTAVFVDTDSYKRYKFDGKKIYYGYDENGNKYTDENYDGREPSDQQSCFNIIGHYGYWLKCSYKNFNGWAFSGFLIKEKFKNKIENIDLLKTIPQLWIPVKDGNINIDLMGGYQFLAFYPDGFNTGYNDLPPCFTISGQDTSVYIITQIDFYNDTISIKYKMKGDNEDKIKTIDIYKTDSESYQFEFGDYTKVEYDNIESACKLPVNLYDEYHGN